MNRHAAAGLLLAIVLGGACASARADEGCTDFKWDVSQERALFAGPAASVAASGAVKSAPAVVPNRLYQLQLLPQDTVSFAVNPGKTPQNAGTYAGLVTLNIPKPGSYRVALDAPLWIDVVANGSLLAAKDFQGQHDCSAPHKIVEFDLMSTQAFVLQLSSAPANSIRLSITATPPRKL